MAKEQYADIECMTALKDGMIQYCDDAIANASPEVDVLDVSSTPDCTIDVKQDKVTILNGGKVSSITMNLENYYYGTHLYHIVFWTSTSGCTIKINPCSTSGAKIKWDGNAVPTLEGNSAYELSINTANQVACITKGASLDSSKIAYVE